MPRTRPEQIVDQSQDPALTQVNSRAQPTIKVKADSNTNSDIRYHLNYTKDKVDHRDYLYTPPTIAKLQSSIDLRQYCTPVEDQGNIGSCTGHAITSAIEIILKKKGKALELSRLFVYYQERLLEGTTRIDAGAYLRDGIKACYTWGTPQERLWAYNTRLFATKPTPAAYSEALTRKITRYERCTNFDSVKAALATGNPVVVGFTVYSSFMSSTVTRTGKMTYPTAREKSMGGHAVCLVGYDDSRGVFIAKNSWGSGWGDRGYFYMPYQVIQNQQMSSDFWVMSDVTS
jgi:C1A family cysteine protease